MNHILQQPLQKWLWSCNYGEEICVFKAGDGSCEASVEGTNCTGGTDSTECGKIDNFVGHQILWLI